MAKNNSKTLAAAVGAAFLTTAALAPVASAAENPFQLSELKSGYQVADAHEGKCGGDKAEGEGKCGEGKADAEGKCGEGKADAEGKCGEGKAKGDGEGKCGEAKCGGDKG